MHPLPARRKRLTGACQKCHQSKVRCNLNVTGIPCSRCVEKEENCEARRRRPYGSNNDSKRVDRARRASTTGVAQHSDLSRIAVGSGIQTTSALAQDVERSSPIVDTALNHECVDSESVPLFVGTISHSSSRLYQNLNILYRRSTRCWRGS